MEPAQMDQELARITDAELAVIKRAVDGYGRPIETAEAAEAAGAVAAEEVVPFLSLVDVKLALLPRIGRAHGAVARVYAEYVRGVRAEAAEAARAEGPADARKAAAALLDALGYSDCSGYAAIRVSRAASALGEFMYYTWRRSARYGVPCAAAPTGGRHRPLYLFNGATYDRVEIDRLSYKAEDRMRGIVRCLRQAPEPGASPLSASAAERLVVKLDTTAIIKNALKRMHALLKDAALLPLLEANGRDGRMSPVEFESAMDTGAYIGMKNGVFDLRNKRFMPKGSVPLNILVSMRVNYDYVGPDDPAFPENCAQIHELYRTLFAVDYADPDDACLAAMWRFMGSLLHRSGTVSAPCVFLGTDRGDNGKSAFTNLIHATLGDYSIAVGGLGGCYYVAKWDANRLVCTETTLPRRRAPPCGNLQAIFHASPLEMGSKRAGGYGGFVARFGSTFSHSVSLPRTEADIAGRMYPRDFRVMHDHVSAWAPCHFVMMVEASLFPPKN